MGKPTAGHFRVGELVILQNATHFVEYDGWPGVVTGGYAPRSCTDLNSMQSTETWCYKVRILGSTDPFTGGEQTVHAMPWQLRRPRTGERHRQLERTTTA